MRLGKQTKPTFRVWVGETPRLANTLTTKHVRGDTAPEGEDGTWLDWLVVNEAKKVKTAILTET